MTADASVRESRGAIEFGPFRYEPAQRQVHAPEGPLRIGSRALDLLDVLLEEPGRLYSRDELVARVWQRTVVEETSLRVQMSSLRRQLGEDGGQVRYITTVPGRGYAFTAPVRDAGDAGAVALLPAAPAHAIPVSIAVPIGRDEVIDRVTDLLSRERLVSVVGPGGVGKTTVVNAVAQARRGEFADGVLRVDLTGVDEPAQALLEACRARPATAPEDALRASEMLIVLDHCDHAIEAVAALVHRLMLHCRGLRFIVAACEPLGIEAERLVRLAPLALPGPRAPERLEDLVSSPAIRLFVERAVAGSASMRALQDNAAAVRRICTFLDGIPLAIELAAARTSAIGVESLAARCEDALHLLSRGRRTAPPRHRSLRASLAWSHARLDALERDALERLAGLAGSFTLEGAERVLADLELGGRAPMLVLLDLCTKSILLREGPADAAPRYRLPHAMRLFVREQCEEAQPS